MIMRAVDNTRTLNRRGVLLLTAQQRPAAPFTAAQSASGRATYTENCAGCHNADLTGAGKLMSVAGGGDTVAALHAAGVADKLSYVSTAGGAFLEWLEGRELPGVAALAHP